MTFAEVLSLARRYSRTDTNIASDAEVYSLINEAVKQIATDVYGFHYHEYLTVEAHFDVTTDMAVHVTISGSSNNDIDSDVVITATTAKDQTGTQVAAALQTALRAAIGGASDITVSWQKFYFTIDAIDSTSITIEAPEDETIYIDANEVLNIGGTGTTTVTGGFPEDCTIKANLAASAIRVQVVEYDKHRLTEQVYEEFVSPELTGDPVYYHVRGQELYIMPSPSEQKLLRVDYKGIPESVTVTDGSEEIPSIIPEQYHRALAYFVAAELLDQTFEEKMATLNRSKYYSMARRLAMELGNKSTNRDDLPTTELWYKVRTT